MTRAAAGPHPEGLRFIKLATVQQDDCEKQTKMLRLNEDNDLRGILQELGTVLSLLNRMATCHLGFHGREHIFEYIAGRTASMCLASLRLINFGHYDEALSLIRSIAEIGNLVQLFMADIEYFKKWRSLSEKQRIREFSPGAVRKKLDELGTVIPTDQEKYS